MAYSPETGLVDEFGGLADIEKKTIRCVGDAKERFGEDALRMMRAVRFAAQLDLHWQMIRRMPSLECREILPISVRSGFRRNW